MEILKKHLKLFVVIAFLILGISLFFIFHKSNDLLSSDMKLWVKASVESKTDVIKELTDNDEKNVQLMMNCLNKISTLPDSADASIRDSATLCYTGIKLKESI